MSPTENHVDYNRSPLKLLGSILVEVEANNKRIQKARILVAKRTCRSIIGRDWLKELKYTIAPLGPGQSINQIHKNYVDVEKYFSSKFPALFERNGRIRGHKVSIQLKPNCRVSQQKGRRIPIQLQEAVNKEIKTLLADGHIERIDSIKDNVFIQPTVITVKKDRSVKIAVDARELNSNIVKDKYMMPNLDNLIDMVAEQVTQSSEQAWFTTLDLKYAYGQLQLNDSTAKHCNFQIFGGEATGTYKFITGFYGLTIMPTEFQRAMDTVLANEKNVFIFIDDILIVTKGSKEEHLKRVSEILYKLDQAHVRLKLEKCQFAKNETHWLGYKLTQSGIQPENSKVQGITERLRPKNIKQMRSFMGAINQLGKSQSFIPNLAQICSPFRSLLKQENEWDWKADHEKAFKEVNAKLKAITELNHFKRGVPLRIICDASRDGLGAVLQQQVENNWQPICFASRFLTPLESKYSINELELLAVVWAIEHFRNYVYGVEFQVLSDHKALATVLKGNKGNKTYSSRLTRWVDRLLPFQFEVIHTPGRTLGIADYLSRHPTELNGNTIKSNELWNDWLHSKCNLSV